MRTRPGRPTLLAVVLCALAGSTAVGCGPSEPDTPSEGQERVATGGPAFTPDSVAVPCGDGTVMIHRGPGVPNQPVFPSGTTGDIDGIQCDFDAFSWNSFIALNLGAEGVVWEAWPESSDIFLAGGDSIPPWPNGAAPPPHTTPAACQSDGATGRALQQLAKRPDALEESTEPFDSGPLIDVEGYYSRFAIFVNQDMYQYIQEHELYSQAGQLQFTEADGETVNFPCGCAFSGNADECPQAGVRGALMIKTAWRILTDADDASRFFTMEAAVVTPGDGTQPATCRTQTVGLTGLHIGHKTQDAPQWVWSTFEQVDNAPVAGTPPDPATRYNYYDPARPDAPVNVAPPQPWDPHAEPVAAEVRSQVVRNVPIPDGAARMNAAVQPLLAGTVWANYALISTQWPAQAILPSAAPPSAASNWCQALNPVDNAGAPAPSFLANTTLETYIQPPPPPARGIPQVSSSCINCHLNAANAVGQNNFSDFTYLLERAQ